MMTATHEKILVHGPVEFAHVLDLSLHVQGNQHGCMSVQGYLDPVSAQRESLRDLEGALFCLQTLRSIDSETPSPVFWGTADDLHVDQVGDVFIADIHIVTPTAMLDVVPRSRSFQNVSMTYKQVVEDILRDTPNASAAFAEIANQPIKKTLIQYKETDWAFIKRLASMLGTQLIPDCTTPFPYFSFGQVPKVLGTLDDDEYTIISDNRFYAMGSSEAGLYKPDFMCYSVPSPQFYRVGDQTKFLGQTMFVCEQDAVLQDGELLYTYKVGRTGWFSQRELPNRKLIGLCLPGTVTWTDREVIHIDLDIDMGRKPGHYPFSWIPEGGNIMYCMPKLGTRAMLYLPSYDTGEAVAITSPRTNGDTCGAMSDPQLRCLTTEHGKRMCLFPQNLIFSGGNPGEVLHVEFNDLSCMLMESTRAIQIAAKLQIEIEAPQVTLSTPQEIQACRAPARARAKVSMIVPKGTGGGNPPTGGRNTFMTMQYQFDLLGEKGILCGTDFKTYDPTPDEPDTKSFSLGSLLLGLAIGVAVAAVVVASVATFGLAATALGALAVASMLCLSGCGGQTDVPAPFIDVTDAGAEESSGDESSDHPDEDQFTDIIEANGEEPIDSLDVAFGCMQKYLDGDLEDGSQLEAAIEYVANYGENTEIKEFTIGQFANHDNAGKFDSDILAWVNFWNYKISSDPRTYPNQMQIRPEIIKAMIAQESSYGVGNDFKNSRRDIMQSLFPGDYNLWIAADKNPLEEGRYHYYDGEKLVDVIGAYRNDASLPVSFTAGTIKNVYGRDNGFGLLDSVITTGGGDSGTEYQVDYTQVTHRMSIAFGVGFVAHNVNAYDSEAQGVGKYGPSVEAYVDAINKKLIELGADTLKS